MSAPIQTLGSEIASTAMTVADVHQTAPDAPRGALSPMQLIAQAISTPDFDVQKLEKLMDLQQRFQDRQAINEFFDALARFHENVRPIVHNRQKAASNERGGAAEYSWATLDAIEDAVRPLLSAVGLSYTWGDAVVNGDLMTVACVLRHRAGHSISSSFTCPWSSNAGMSVQQKYISAQTFCRRLSLTAVLGITTERQAGDDPKDATPVSDDQLHNLQTAFDVLLDGKSDAQKTQKRTRFLAILGATSFSDIPASKYDDAMTLLTPKSGGAS